MSTHDDFRQALLDGEINETVRAHVETCAECGPLAAALARLEQASPALVDVYPAPSGLADRILVRVGAESTVAHDGGRDNRVVPLRRRVRRNLVLAAAAAAVVVAVVATSVVVRDSGMAPRPEAGPEGAQTPTRVLLVAAENTADQGSARIRMQGTFVVDPDSPLFGTGTYELDSEGEIRFPDRLHLDYTLTTTDDTPPILAFDPVRQELIVVDGESWAREPGEPWVFDGEGSGGAALSRTLYRPETTLEVLRAADGEPVDLGIDTIAGERLHGYRFTVPAELFPVVFPPPEGPPPDHTVVVYVSEDDQVLRRMVVSTRGTTGAPDLPIPASWRTEFVIELSDFGIAVDIEPPPPSEVAP